MKAWVFALVLASACVAIQSAAMAGQTPTYGDARSTASDEEVRVARRAYRAACQTRHSLDYCECMTGGMAQILPPADLAIATAAFSGATVQASDEMRARVEARRTEVDRGCAQYRG